MNEITARAIAAGTEIAAAAEAAYQARMLLIATDRRCKHVPTLDRLKKEYRAALVEFAKVSGFRNVNVASDAIARRTAKWGY